MGRLRVIGVGGAVVAIAVASATIKPWEGLRLIGYADPIGIPTDCWGNTRGAKVGVARTQLECEALLDAEVRHVMDGLGQCVHVDVTPPQAAALISWAYNVGIGAACGSTLVRKLNAGEPPQSWCMELGRWVYAGGIRWRGLERRRAAETELCMHHGTYLTGFEVT